MGAPKGIPLPKCEPGCTCGKHAGRSGRKCEPGCTCKRHDYVWREEWKPPPRKCPEGCTCLKHTNSGTWLNRSPEEREQIRRAKRQRQYTKNRDKWHTRQYGVSPIQLFEEQGGLCYACGGTLSLTQPRGYAVDHDHTCCPFKGSCGKCVLGLACARCNKGFGYFNDDPVLMVQAASRRMERMRTTANARQL